MSPEQEAEERGLDTALPAKATRSGSGKGAPGSYLPLSKAGRAWRRSARKLRWDPRARRLGLGSREDATLGWLELAGLTPSGARRWPGVGNPHLQGAEPAGSASPCHRSQGILAGVGRGAVGREGPVREGTALMSLPVAEIRSGGARAQGWRAGRSVGTGAQNAKLSWRPT